MISKVQSFGAEAIANITFRHCNNASIACNSDCIAMLLDAVNIYDITVRDKVYAAIASVMMANEVACEQFSSFNGIGTMITHSSDYFDSTHR